MKEVVFKANEKEMLVLKKKVEEESTSKKSLEANVTQLRNENVQMKNKMKAAKKK